MIIMVVVVVVVVVVVGGGGGGVVESGWHWLAMGHLNSFEWFVAMMLHDTNTHAANCSIQFYAIFRSVSTPFFLLWLGGAAALTRHNGNELYIWVACLQTGFYGGSLVPRNVSCSFGRVCSASCIASCHNFLRSPNCSLRTSLTSLRTFWWLQLVLVKQPSIDLQHICTYKRPYSLHIGTCKFL